MSSIWDEFDHLKIQMKDIISATNNFHKDKLIGGGGFGPVYKGELSLPNGPTMVAFKRLDRRHGQGNTEFWKEIMMLSRYRHENLVSLFHFSIEGDERVLVYKFAPRGSLDRYLSDATLTWNQRLHICIGAARALTYLHDPMDTQQRVIHRDMKSSNIFLDNNWIAKVSDFGLSKASPANQPRTFMVTNPKWKECCEEKKLDEIIFQALKEQMVWDSVITFSAVAYRCLNRGSRKDRPLMDEIVKELEFALSQQQNSGGSGDGSSGSSSGDGRGNADLVKIANLIASPQDNTLLPKGVLVDEGKRWISINKSKQIHEMISATQCFHGNVSECVNASKSRFSNVVVCTLEPCFEVNVSTKFLSPDTAYTVNLVFNIMGTKDPEKAYYWEYATCWAYVPFRYKLDEWNEYQNSCDPSVREDGWLMVQLYTSRNKNKKHNLRIEFMAPRDPRIFKYILEGIELRPI
ncbi:unnamed protein product [Lactuca saligna]|uniref:Protein kinase domain-containing protein n=1 Tax=Lactuca saligna TaxID=75948 RepID=A0AA35Z2I7_LACSI|nr:unnamed protein product [Lactuca saligna]